MHKVPAGLAVINGFGKSAGLMQVQELGVLESPIALTGTLAVGTASPRRCARCAAAQKPELARSLPTVNPLVFECNDGWLNDAREMAVQESHVAQALAAARAAQHGRFEQGSVGAGRGMSCLRLKGGIGRRRAACRGKGWTLCSARWCSRTRAAPRR
jgi:D-aminopeptidase